MTRQIEPLNHEMGRLNTQSDAVPIQRDIGFIVSLFKYKNVQLKVIGDQFIQNFWQKNPTTVCLYLIALYEELNATTHVNQRIIICYLIYRLKDLWKSETVDKTGMFSHPYLLIFVKIFWTFMSPPGRHMRDRSLLHLLGDFPKITAQEAYFVGRILTSPHVLEDLFELTPNSIATDTTGIDQAINIDPLKMFIEQQLRQFPFFEAVVLSTSATVPPRQAFSAFADPAMFPSLQQIVLSLVSPNAAHASLNNNHLNTRNSTSNHPVSRRTIINSSYGFFSTPNTSNLSGLATRTLPTSSKPVSNNNTLPSVLAKLFNENYTSPLNTPTKIITKPPGIFNSRSNSPLDEINRLNEVTFGGDGADLRLSPSATDSPVLSSSLDNQSIEGTKMQNQWWQTSKLPDPIGTPLVIKRSESTTSSPALSQADKMDDEVSSTRKLGFDMLCKIVGGSGAALSKSQITKLLGILSLDKEILPMIEISTREFEIIVESQPDVAAEVLVQLHSSSSNELYNTLDVLIKMELSVQSIVAVSRFISSCERNSMSIPESFLNNYITHCIQTCEQVNANQVSNHHRLVRVVCVFFSTLVRLSNFDIKPRIAEIQSFTTMFPHVKETSQLYKSLTQMK